MEDARHAEAQAAAKAAKAARDEARRRELRMRRLAPAQDDVIVKLVRGLESATSADRDGSEVERGRRSSEEVEGLEAPSSRSSRPTLLSDENGAEAVGGGGESESETEIDGVAGTRHPSLVRRERSRLVGSTIYVDTTHRDFQERWRRAVAEDEAAAPPHSRAIDADNERLCAYLAALVALHYRERAYIVAGRSRVEYVQAHEEMMESYCKLERRFRAALLEAT